MLLFIRCGEKDLPNLYIHPFYTCMAVKVAGGCMIISVYVVLCVCVYRYVHQCVYV